MKNLNSVSKHKYKVWLTVSGVDMWYDGYEMLEAECEEMARSIAISRVYAVFNLIPTINSVERIYK